MLAQWVPTEGPEGGFVYSFAQIGERIFAATYGNGVWSSQDRGYSWESHPKGFGGFWTRCLFASGGCLFAGTDNGLFMTRDTGKSWVMRGLPGKKVYAITGINDSLYAACYESGIFFSRDGGVHWKQIKEIEKPRAIAVTPFGVFAGSEVSGVDFRPFGSERWVSSNKGIGSLYVRSLHFTGNILIAASGDQGLYRVSRIKRTWMPAKGSIQDFVVFCLAGTDSIVVAGTSQGGVFLSRNHGITWENIGLKGEWVRGIWFDGHRIFAGTYGPGIFVSEDMGKTWNIRNTSLVASYPETLSLLGDSLFSYCSFAGLFQLDSTATWKQKMYAEDFTNGFEYLHSTPDGWLFPSANQGIFLSLDHGENWEKLPTPFPKLKVLGFARNKDQFYLLKPGGIVFVSPDGQTGWEKILDTPFPVQSFLPVDSIILLSSKEKGIFRYSLQDDSLQAVTLPGMVRPEGIFLGKGRDIIFLSRQKVVFHTCDSGKSWTKIQQGISAHGIGCLDFRDSIWFAGNDQGEFYSRSRNATKWTLVDITPNLPIFTVKCGKKQVFAGTRGKGVWKRPLADICSKEEDPLK